MEVYKVKVLRIPYTHEKPACLYPVKWTRKLSPKKKDSKVSGDSGPRAEAKVGKKLCLTLEQFTTVPKWYKPQATFLLDSADQPSLSFCKSKPCAELKV